VRGLFSLERVMMSRGWVWVAVGVAVFTAAAFLVGNAAWNFWGVSMAVRSCAAASHSAGAARDGFAQCMSEHGFGDELLAAACAKESNVASVPKGSARWADALAGCIDKRGGHATVERKTDLASGVTTYSVLWPLVTVTKGVSYTSGTVTTGTSVTVKQPSSAP
jgi:hypothetical protein